MGVFDYVRCKYPLPLDDPGINDKVYQTKDTPEQYLALYEIREDGTLWVAKKKGDEPERLKKFTGEIRFYDFHSGTDGWIEFSAYFVYGEVLSMNLIERTRRRLST